MTDFLDALTAGRTVSDRPQFGARTAAAPSGATRVAVIGAGISGLSCARELVLRGYQPVVFEASDQVGGRCGSRWTRLGWFDDSAQVINGTTKLAAYAPAQPGRLAALHAWTAASPPVDTDRCGKLAPPEKEEDDAAELPLLQSLGMVGVPSMSALANTIAQPLDVRLHTPIVRAHRRNTSWVLEGAAGEIDEDFQAMVVAIPAPLAMPLIASSTYLTETLQSVRYRNRWVLLLGAERSIHLPSYREFDGGPIERIAALHSKPGQTAPLPQRWFIEASERWSLEHAQDDAETVADLLLANFQAHARQSVTPHFLLAHNWQHAFVDAPAQPAQAFKHLWDEQLMLGVCGDRKSVV